jgi:hypothetical protein
MKEQDKQAKKPLAKSEIRSLLEDWQSFRAWQEALCNAHTKRVPVT